MVSPAGIEPAAYSLGGYRSIQLSYGDTNRLKSGKGNLSQKATASKAGRHRPVPLPLQARKRPYTRGYD